MPNSTPQALNILMLHGNLDPLSLTPLATSAYTSRLHTFRSPIPLQKPRPGKSAPESLSPNHLPLSHRSAPSSPHRHPRPPHHQLGIRHHHRRHQLTSHIQLQSQQQRRRRDRRSPRGICMVATARRHGGRLLRWPGCGTRADCGFGGGFGAV